MENTLPEHKGNDEHESTIPPPLPPSPTIFATHPLCLSFIAPLTLSSSLFERLAVPFFLPVALRLCALHKRTNDGWGGGRRNTRLRSDGAWSAETEVCPLLNALPVRHPFLSPTARGVARTLQLARQENTKAWKVPTMQKEQIQHAAANSKRHVTRILLAAMQQTYTIIPIAPSAKIILVISETRQQTRKPRPLPTSKTRTT